jgi:sterol 14alpha-demethylase
MPSAERAVIEGGRPPTLPGGLPWLGHALDFRRDPVAFLLRGRERFGDAFSFRLAGTRLTALTGLPAQAAFFQAPEDQLSARAAYRFMVAVFGKGVVYDASAEDMDAQIGFILPALRDERLRAYARVMQEEAEAYVERWGDRGEVDLLVAMNELTVFIASRCLVGGEFRRAVTEEFAALYHDLEGSVNLLTFLQPRLPVPSARRRDRARARMTTLISRVVADRRARGVEAEDFLQSLMSARYPDGRTLDDAQITGLLLATVFAGQHTSAVLGTWTGVLLLDHEAHLAAVRAEQGEVLGPGREMTVEALRQLVTLERCIKEAERMHPPLILLMRRVLRDLAVGPHVVPAGDIALVSPAAAHRIPEVFADPDRYDPDRFGPGRQEDRKHRHALIGFGGGHHRCIGSTFAYQQVKAIWSVLLHRFDLALVGHDHAPDYATFVPAPRGPCLVRYRRRPRASHELAPAAAAVGAQPS